MSRFMNEIFISARNGEFISDLLERIPQLKPLRSCLCCQQKDGRWASAEETTCMTLKHLWGVLGNMNDNTIWAAACLCDIAMPACKTKTEQGYAFRGHPHKGAYECIPLLKELGFSYDETREITALIEDHEILFDFKRLKGTFEEKIEKLDEKPYLDKLLLIGLCNALARNPESNRGNVKMCLDIMRRTHSRYYSDAKLYVEHITETVSWEDKNWYGVAVSA